MSQSEEKVVQYLNEAHATEVGLVRVLQSQIAMTPRGSYRASLEKHLRETQDHANRVRARLGELSAASNPVLAGIGFMENAISQTLALWKTPLDLMRGASAEEKILKNAKDTCATEALEIATYTALEELANAVGDETTARLAASIRADEERMLERVISELPTLARAVVRSEVEGKPSYDLSKTGAAEAMRESLDETVEETKRVTRGAADGAKTAARQTRRATAAAKPPTPGKRAAAPTADDLPIGGYDDLTADEINSKLSEVSQADLAKIDAYERAHEERATVLAKINSLRGDEPWAGYDESTVDEIRSALSDADEDTANAVRRYERAHKNRAGVLNAVEPRLATA